MVGDEDFEQQLARAVFNEPRTEFEYKAKLEVLFRYRMLQYNSHVWKSRMRRCRL